ncbi:hypothetical protein H8959_020512 [Pygathrix nigripes]
MKYGDVPSWVLREAEFEMELGVQKIHCESSRIPINHNDFKIFKNIERQLCEVLQNKFGCISTVVSPVREGNSTSLQVFRKMLTPRIELSVWKDDLTTHAVDAVVNAANEDLLHGGGLALALVKAGGFEIQEESKQFVATFGKVSTWWDSCHGSREASLQTDHPCCWASVDGVGYTGMY